MAIVAIGQLLPDSRSPDEALGDLFYEVQQKQLYGDGKVFPDLMPRRSMKEIKKSYELTRHDTGFNLQDFIAINFNTQSSQQPGYVIDTSRSMRQHIRELWAVLVRKNQKVRSGSLVPLPYAYIVPGGRFEEQFYWDSYFSMLGLAADGQWDLIEGMMKNYAFMIRKYGFIPTANRTYFLSRSQPPFFSHMVHLLASKKGNRAMVEYLPYLLAEYRFWMKGYRSVDQSSPYRRAVKMPDGSTLNRYYDNKSTPRPESLREDLETTHGMAGDMQEQSFLHLRAAAESGWDFSSRWFVDPNDIGSIHTTDIIPVDLNCLLYDLEKTIAKSYSLLKQPLQSRKFENRADSRAKAILDYCWDAESGYFKDYDIKFRHQTECLSLAGVFPLYSKIATQKQAELVADRIKSDFLKDGGLTATLMDNGQQWDSPNGWAPLHWVAVVGLRNYGYDELATDIKNRFIATAEHVYASSGRLIEKYDVSSNDRIGGGGEYELQDGFGWTNGVLAALIDEGEGVA